MIDSEHVALLLFRYIRKELSPEELAELKTWREADVKNEEFFQAETDPEYIRAAYTRRVQAREKAWRQLEKKYPDHREPETWSRVVTMLRSSRIAATFTTIALLAGFYFFFTGKHHDNPGKLLDAEQTSASIDLLNGTVIAMDDFHRGFLAARANIRFEWSPGGERVYAATNKTDIAKNSMFKLYTARKGHLILRLPDSSHVWLNEQSAIWYPPNFSGDSINIIIEGEAYFQQAKNSKKFFSILLPLTSTGQRSSVNGQRSDTIMINTSFGRLNLRSYPDEDSSTITLLKGNATLGLNEKTGLVPSMKLLPGQQTIWDGTKFSSPARTEIKKVMDWEKW
jgi:transmembrane sensor